MNWNALLYDRRFRLGLCAGLILALLLSLFRPGMLPEMAEPVDPMEDAQISQIHTLQMGQNTQEPNGGGSTAEGETEPTQPRETVPEETQPEETEPQDTHTQTPEPGPGGEGQDDGAQGEEGGEEAELDLAMVMTWYKYGTQPKTIVCGPSEAVSKTLNTAQLPDSRLKYAFSLTGAEADHVHITAVSLKAGDGAYELMEENGETVITLPEGGGQRDYTFRVDAKLEKRDAQGNPVEADITFTYVLHCVYAMDLELELTWQRDGADSTITCPANKTAAKTIESHELTENVFNYTPRLVGALAENAEIVKASYVTASGESGMLNPGGGSLILRVPDGAEEETYDLTFEVRLPDEEGKQQTVLFQITIRFAETADVGLSFTWLEKGITRRTLLCRSGETVSIDIKNNQLSAGAVKYEIALTGADSESARILNISYTSEASGGGTLTQSGRLPMALPEGYAANTYTVTVVVLAEGKQMTFRVELRYAMDVYLQMAYAVDGVDRTVTCENGKTATAEAIYDDQLTEGMLPYAMSIAGQDGGDLAITGVTCYQSGSGRTVSLESTDELRLLLKDGKTGENTFSVTAEDRSGNPYTFRINIPYKHRGEKTVKITTNLRDGQVVTNETNVNLSVNAWSEDSGGNVIGYIPANGTDTKLIVKLDGEQIPYISSSGSASEYNLYPANPETGDTNTHILHIYAEDAYGNYGELTLTLTGQRSQAGQKKGTATIYVDMTVLGLGVVDSVNYEVLADEPISYSVAKAVLGMDTGEPFGAAKESLGWSGRYGGTLDTGFFLQSLTPGYTAHTLEGSSWNQYGSTEAEILQAIDDYFGKGTGLATLWRCIYRNGLNKSGGSGGAYGEFDYTSGSGWLFSLDGVYYPGQSMTEWSLQDGDVLTLRYSLAYGWDVGGGTAGYGNTTGYCVSALNGSYYISHQMETVENPDGSVSSMCRCCGLVEACAHVHTVCEDLGDGTHIRWCEDCRTAIGDPAEHTWECGEDAHTCTACGASEHHAWNEVEGSNTATCTEPGTRTVICGICALVRQEESPARGHSLNNRWNHTAAEHYRKCSVCAEIIAESLGAHQYVYDEGDNDWYCKVCDAGHDWDYCGNGGLTLTTATCQKLSYHCGECGLDFVREGTFDDYHAYSGGACTLCGAPDPNTPPPETEPPEEGQRKRKDTTRSKWRKNDESENQ